MQNTTKKKIIHDLIFFIVFIELSLIFAASVNISHFFFTDFMTIMPFDFGFNSIAYP